jgi:hypothetical protein
LLLLSRPSIAVLPFACLGEPSRYAAIADALRHELIIELSRMLWLFVTARGSSFRLSAAETGMVDVGRLLGVRYCLTGTVDILDSSLSVTVELFDTRDALDDAEASLMLVFDAMTARHGLIIDVFCSDVMDTGRGPRWTTDLLARLCWSSWRCRSPRPDSQQMTGSGTSRVSTAMCSLAADIWTWRATSSQATA